MENGCNDILFLNIDVWVFFIIMGDEMEVVLIFWYLFFVYSGGGVFCFVWYLGIRYMILVFFIFFIFLGYWVFIKLDDLVKLIVGFG